MDLDGYTLKDMLLTAVRAEIDSHAVYSALADMVGNAFLKDKLLYLAGEEEKHMQTVEKIYSEQFPGEEMTVPDLGIVPLPDLKMPDESVPLSEVLGSAMDAEMAAHDFYTSMAGEFDNPSVKITLTYFAAMEMGHYQLLEVEKENAERMEDYDDDFGMMHVGP